MARRTVRGVVASVVGGGVCLALTVVVVAQTSTPRPPPPPVAEPGTDRRTGGSTPFRDRAFGGTSFEAATLEQPGCPLGVSVESLNRGERGMMLTLKLTNQADQALTRQVVGAWVIVADGTVRGQQRYEGRRAIPAGESRTIDLSIRTTTVMPGDVIIVAVHEVAGGRPWRQDISTIERDIRAAVLR